MLQLKLSSHTIEVTENNQFRVTNNIIIGLSIPKYYNTEFLLLGLNEVFQSSIQRLWFFWSVIYHYGPLHTKEKQRLQQFELELLKLFMSLVKTVSKWKFVDTT